jgi:hypothetical protein
MGSLQGYYFSVLADCAGLKGLPSVVKMVYEYVADWRKVHLMHYKADSYTLLAHGNSEKQIPP